MFGDFYPATVTKTIAQNLAANSSSYSNCCDDHRGIGKNL